MARISILLVDDNPTFIRFATRFINKEDTLQVIGTAADGVEAVARAQALQPDVTLLDLSMPQGGVDVIPQICAAAPTTTIIVVTSMDPEAYRARVLENGAHAFVSKKDLTEALIPTILDAKGTSPPCDASGTSS